MPKSDNRDIQAMLLGVSDSKMRNRRKRRNRKKIKRYLEGRESAQDLKNQLVRSAVKTFVQKNIKEPLDIPMPTNYPTIDHFCK